MDFKGLEGLVSIMQQSKEVIVNDAAEKIKFLTYVAETNFAEGIKAGKYVAEFIGKGYGGALPHFNQQYINQVMNFENLELTKSSIALDFILGTGYIAASNVFAENGLVSNLVGFDLSSSTRDFLIIYGCVDIAEGLVRTGHVAYFGTPIGTIKNEILGEVAKAVTISQSYWGPKLIDPIKKDFNDLKDFVSLGLKYNFGLVDDKVENILENIYKSGEDY